MAYQKAYFRIFWENYPSNKSPLNEQNLNRIDYAVEEHDNRIMSLDMTKLDKTTANSLVKKIDFMQDTGVFKITYLDNSVATIDTKLEKLAINFRYDVQTQKLIILLDDGTEQKVDLSQLITQYEFRTSDTIMFAVDEDGNVSAEIRDHSIGEEKLREDYLADIKIEAEKARQQVEEATNQALLAKSYTIGESGLPERSDEAHSNAKYYWEQLEELYHITRLCNGETPQLRRMTPVTIDAQTPYVRAAKEGMYFNGDTPQIKVERQEVL